MDIEQSRAYALLDDAIRQMGQERIGAVITMVRGLCRIKTATTKHGCWIECIRYVDPKRVGWVRDVLYSSKQAETEYRRVFEIYMRVAEGTVHTPDLVRRHREYPVGQKVRLA